MLDGRRLCAWWLAALRARFAVVNTCVRDEHYPINHVSTESIALFCSVRPIRKISVDYGPIMPAVC